MFEENPHRAVENAIQESSPQVIGVSVRNIDDQKMDGGSFLLDQVKDVVSDCKALSDAPIVLGGPGYSMFPVACLKYLGADMGIQGEGEKALPELLRRIEREDDYLSDIPGLYLPGLGLRGNRIFADDLNLLPLPGVGAAFPDSYESEDFLLPVQTRRGCPMRCSYCSTSIIEGSVYRNRSHESVVQWLSDWVSAGVRRFFFVDNTFNLPPSYAKALCSKIIAAGLDISWRCILYPKNIDEELIDLMVRAGCKEVSLGFESGNEQVLKAMNKKFKPNDVRIAARLLADKGLRAMGFLLLGGPGETQESVKESLEFADSLSLSAVRVTVGIRIYPNTSLSETAVAEGLISPDDDLLHPKFYLAKETEGYVHETVRDWMSKRPNWIM
jgi:radical SAM superfamily enzyme YgiQ (UPF0313 family)